MFLSKLLSTAESHYWPTELETAGLVWTVKKIRHLIDFTDKSLTIAYTDHSAVISIAKQTTLSSSNTDKLNICLVWASQYLTQFNLDIHYKLSKHHLMSDALFWLSVKKLKPETSNILDDLTENDSYTFIVSAYHFIYSWNKNLTQGAFNVTLVKLTNEFKDWLKQTYIDNVQWSAVQDSLQGLKNNDTSMLYSDFRLRNDLIYLLEDDSSEWLMIPQSLEKKIFEMSHDSCSHQGFHWAFAHLMSSVYLDWNVFRCLQSYIEHCSSYQVNQMKRHKLYSSLQLIQSCSLSFDTITINFVMALSETTYLEETVNALLNVTDKFSKQVLMISDKDTFTARDWAWVLIRALQITDWDMLRQILSDCDSKFLSELWTGLFSHLEIKLLLSTAWHPQTDGVSEQTNQMIEIALWYHVTEHSDTPWSETLIPLQITLNNSENASTEKTSTELMYDLKMNEGLSLLSFTVSYLNTYDLTQARDLHCWQAQNSQLFALMWFKQQYNMKHKKLDLKKSDLIYLQLHHSYNLSGLQNPKLSNQRVDSFKIIKKIDFLTYYLELLCTMKIHSVVFITHLKPCSIRDLYKCLRSDKPSPVLDESEDW